MLVNSSSNRAWLFAMLLTSGCSGDRAPDRAPEVLMDVDNLWQGSIPITYDRDAACQHRKPNLLIPHDISASSPLYIELYSCWRGSTIIDCSGENFFQEARFDSENNKVNISLWKGDDGPEECPARAAQFKKYHTFEINGSWQSGELEIVVQSSDEDLTGFITVE